MIVQHFPSGNTAFIQSSSTLTTNAVTEAHRTYRTAAYHVFQDFTFSGAKRRQEKRNHVNHLEK